MSHDRVVDTSFLFEGSDKKFSTPSLKDVVRVALGRDIQHGSHDSVTDAKVCGRQIQVQAQIQRERGGVHADRPADREEVRDRDPDTEIQREGERDEDRERV